MENVHDSSVPRPRLQSPCIRQVESSTPGDDTVYERFYGFRERPFDLSPDPRHLVLTEGHREAIAIVEYAIRSRKGMALLVGEAGTGKTTVIRAAIERQPPNVFCVHVHNPAL